MLAYGSKSVLSVSLEDYKDDLEKSRVQLNDMFRLFKEVEKKAKEVNTSDKLVNERKRKSNSD